jgi:hypothetical protein
MIEDTPMLPYDYVMSFIISLCPYIWHTVMDPRVEALYMKKTIDPKIEEDAKKKVFYYYLCVIVVVTNMVYYSL